MASTSRVVKMKKISPYIVQVTVEHLVVIQDGFDHEPLLDKMQSEIARNLPVGGTHDFIAADAEDLNAGAGLKE